MVSGDKCVRLGADATKCNPGYTSTLPSVNIPPPVKKTYPFKGLKIR